ncbi:MAG TPA: ParB/RepB/Spo0J family partition protein [Candidatus Scybalousia intestinigallinarum]|nr:ParB/RepB/Spo0J family partition protein [Candidatus Scybalousia intestinigallinarum]
MDREVVDLYLDDIIPNRFQPREVFNEQALRELADSIRAHGVIQPIIVRKIGDKYEIIAGERRYKASAMAGLTKIPAIIRNLDDKETSKVALLENLQRKDLTPIEEARTYQKILELDSMTQEELGRTMGKSQAAIANKMRLLSLPDEVQEALLHDQISERHARSLLNLDSREDQINMLHAIIEKRMTVRELDNEIRKLKGIEEPTSNENISESTNQEGTPVSITPEPIEIPSPVTPSNSMTSTNSDGSRHPIDLLASSNQTSPKVEVSSPDSTVVSTPKPVVRNILTLSDEDDEDFTQLTPDQASSTLANTEEAKPRIKYNDPVEELLDDEELYSLKDAVKELRRTVTNLENRGFVIKVEELDFENTYQVVVKINKDI